MLRVLVLTTAFLAITAGFTPAVSANHQYTYVNNDPYSASTPNLYRRTQRSHTCQLPSRYQGSASSNTFQGWLLPGLIWGDCPLRFPSLLKATGSSSSSAFGSLNW